MQKKAAAAPDTPCYVTTFVSNKHAVAKVPLIPSASHSRYKTRPLQIDIVHGGTCFVNLNDVAKDMQVPPNFITAYIGFTLSARVYISRRDPRQLWKLRGTPGCLKLSQIMTQFIEEVVLCPQCKLPERFFELQGSKIVGVCQSCGKSEKLQSTNEKFLKFITEHPPTQQRQLYELTKPRSQLGDLGTTFSGLQLTNLQVGVGNGLDDLDTDELLPKTQGATKPVSSSDDEQDEDEDEDDDDATEWLSDTSTEAVARRAAALQAYSSFLTKA